MNLTLCIFGIKKQAQASHGCCLAHIFILISYSEEIELWPIKFLNEVTLTYYLIYLEVVTQSNTKYKLRSQAQFMLYMLTIDQMDNIIYYEKREGRPG